jgi:ribonuclease E
MPNNPRAGGISRRIEGEERDELKEALRSIEVPKGMGCIVRTAGVGRSAEELQWDLGVLLNIWEAIQREASARPAPFLIHQESDVLIRAVRDYLRPDVGEIIIDKQEAYDKVRQYLELIRPDFVSRVKLYTDREFPLFNRYQIESQIESAFQREVQLPSGGSIVIDPTEALISIDINSARATKGADIEETALNTNIEAAQEIARQLRLRDIGGLIVIDFIDMSPVKHQREVERVLAEALKQDRARVQIGRISRFGLLEMSRQRLKPSLGESSQETCPRCNGVGRIRGIESLSLSIFRLIEEEATKESTSQVQAFLPVEVATFLLNEKRKIIAAIEKRRKVKVVLIPNPDFETPHFEILRLREDEVTDQRSFELKIETPDEETKGKAYTPPAAKTSVETPAVQTIQAPTAPIPVKPKAKEKKKSGPGLFARIFSFFFGSEDKKKKKTNEKSRNDRGRRPNQRNNKNRRPRRNQNNRGSSNKEELNKSSGNNSSNEGAQASRNVRESNNRDQQEQQRRQNQQQRQAAQLEERNQQQNVEQVVEPRQPETQTKRQPRMSRAERLEQQQLAREENRKLAEQALAANQKQETASEVKHSDTQVTSQTSTDADVVVDKIKTNGSQPVDVKADISTKAEPPKETQEPLASNKDSVVTNTIEKATNLGKVSGLDAESGSADKHSNEPNVEHKDKPFVPTFDQAVNQASEVEAVEKSDVQSEDTQTFSSQHEEASNVTEANTTDTGDNATNNTTENNVAETPDYSLTENQASQESASSINDVTSREEVITNQDSVVDEGVSLESEQPTLSVQQDEAQAETTIESAADKQKATTDSTASEFTGQASSPMAKPEPIGSLEPIELKFEPSVNLASPITQVVAKDSNAKSISESPMAKASIASLEQSISSLEQELEQQSHLSKEPAEVTVPDQQTTEMVSESTSDESENIAPKHSDESEQKSLF